MQSKLHIIVVVFIAAVSFLVGACAAEWQCRTEGVTKVTPATYFIRYFAATKSLKE
jgi:hypothetical protein